MQSVNEIWPVKIITEEKKLSKNFTKTATLLCSQRIKSDLY